MKGLLMAMVVAHLCTNLFWGQIAPLAVAMEVHHPVGEKGDRCLFSFLWTDSLR
jgi:hypothetical protein